MTEEKATRREYVDGSVYDEAYYQHGGHGSPYQGYNESLIEHPGFIEYAELLARAFQPVRVLEVGCATGIIVNHLRNLGIDAIGIDISDYATKNAVCGDVIQASAADLPFVNRAFDLVFGCHCIEHIPPFLLSKAIAEQARVSRRWVFHVMPIWKLGPYQWTAEERADLHKTDITDLNLEDVIWWISHFTANGDLRYRPDVRLRGQTELWANDYNYCQVCFEKEEAAAKTPFTPAVESEPENAPAPGEDTLPAAPSAELRHDELTGQLQRLAGVQEEMALRVADLHNALTSVRASLPYRALRKVSHALRLVRT